MDGIRSLPQKIVRSSTEGIQAGTHNQCQVQQFRKYPFWDTMYVPSSKMHHQQNASSETPQNN